MRGNEATEHDQSPGVIPSAPWRVSAIEILPDYRLKVQFIDGTEGTVDLSRLVFDENAGVFASLRDSAIFEQASIVHGAITWPDEIDLAPDAMYEEVKKGREWRL